MIKPPLSRKALFKRAEAFRQQAKEAGDRWAREALESLAKDFEILAEKAPPDDESASEPDHDQSDL
jgi:hypothetical protein